MRQTIKSNSYDRYSKNIPDFLLLEGINHQQNEVLRFLYYVMGFGCVEQPFVWAYTVEELAKKVDLTTDKTRTAIKQLADKGYITQEVRRPCPSIQHMRKENGEYRMAYNVSHFSLIADHPDFESLEFRGNSLPDALREKAAYAAEHQRKKREKRQQQILKNTQFSEDWAAFSIEMAHRLIIHKRELQAWHPGKYFSNDHLYADFPDAFIKSIFGVLLYRYRNDTWRLNHIKREFRYFCLTRQEFTPQEIEREVDVPFHSLSVRGFKKAIFNSKTGECIPYFERDYYRRKAISDGMGEVYFDECWEALEAAQSKGFAIPDLKAQEKVILFAAQLVQEGIINLPEELKKQHYKEVTDALLVSKPNASKMEANYEYSKLLLLKYTFYYDPFYQEMHPVTVEQRE